MATRCDNQLQRCQARKSPTETWTDSSGEMAPRCLRALEVKGQGSLSCEEGSGRTRISGQTTQGATMQREDDLESIEPGRFGPGSPYDGIEWRKGIPVQLPLPDIQIAEKRSGYHSLDQL